MDFSAFLDALQRFETDKMVRYLGELNLDELIHNPWFLGAMGALAVISLVCKWRALLALVLGVTGMAWLVSYTVSQGTEINELGNQNLLIFLGGAVLVIIVMIYLLFIRND